MHYYHKQWIEFVPTEMFWPTVKYDVWRVFIFVWAIQPLPCSLRCWYKCSAVEVFHLSWHVGLGSFIIHTSFTTMLKLFSINTV